MAGGSASTGRAAVIPVSLKGFLASGMLDWPGRLAATLFLGGCSLRCPYCHNPDLVTRPHKLETLDLDAVFDRLDSRRDWVEAVVISGGEPTVSPGLTVLLRELKEEGYLTKLDTNGTNPDMVTTLIDSGLLDSVAVDIKTSFARYHEATGGYSVADDVARTIDHVVLSETHHEFRTTVVPHIVNIEDIKSISMYIGSQGAKKFVLQQFKQDSTLNSRMRWVEPYQADVVEHMAAIAQEHVPTEVRGI